MPYTQYRKMYVHYVYPNDKVFESISIHARLSNIPTRIFYQHLEAVLTRVRGVRIELLATEMVSNERSLPRSSDDDTYKSLSLNFELNRITS